MGTQVSTHCRKEELSPWGCGSRETERNITRLLSTGQHRASTGQVQHL